MSAVGCLLWLVPNGIVVPLSAFILKSFTLMLGYAVLLFTSVDGTSTLLSMSTCNPSRSQTTCLSFGRSMISLCTEDEEKDVLELCPRSFDVFLQVGFVVENPKPKQQVEQGLNMDRINEINDWFWESSVTQKGCR